MHLVFVHGAGSSSAVWRSQKKYFSKAHSVTAIDLPGHGETPGNGRDSIKDYVEDVRAAIQHLEDVVLIGHSMGGAITMVYALEYPLRACVLAGTGARLRVFPAVLEKIRSNYEETVDFILEYVVHNKTEQIMKQSKKEMLNTSPDVMYKDLLACDTFDVMHTIHTLSIPTLVVCGDQDMLAPLKYSEYLAHKILFSSLGVIEDCGHMLMLEKPHVFNEVLERFLREL